MPQIAFLMGKSSSGKDTIYKELVNDKTLNLKTVVLYTTRPRRDGETQGIEYNFVSDEVADKFVEDKKVIEIRSYDTVYGVWRYFTADDGQINLSEGKYIVIGTLEAYSQFLEYFGKEVLLPIYIEVDDGIRLLRALEREKCQTKPKYDEMCRRFLADNEDFSEENIKKCDISKRYYNNGDISECIEAIKADIVSML